MPLNLDQVAIQIIVNTVIIGPVLWLAGRALEGKKAKFTHGLWIAALGTIIGEIFGYFFTGGVISTIIMIIVWLGLIKHFFQTGWIKAFLIAIVAIILFIVITAIFAILGFVALTAFLPKIT